MSCACVLLLVSVTVSPIDASLEALPEFPPLTPLDPLALADAAYRFNPVDASPLDSVGSSLDDIVAPAAQSRPADRPFGLADTRSWLINAGVATEFEDIVAGRMGLGVSYFVADDVSFDAEFNLLYFDQPVHDALGVNLNFMIRWHLWHDEARTWSIYIDAGAGIMIADEDVPDLGSRFNFTPQMGAGMSFKLGDNSRLYIGARWHHVSNANIFEQNPGRDLGLFYMMVGFPF